jgi:uncharacterized protein (DUF58 family)
MTRAQARLRSAVLTRRRPRVCGVGMPHPRRADGYEFAELRAYVPGDDPRRIDWAATARAGAMQTRVLYEDHALILAGALDASRSMFVGRTRSAYDVGVEALGAWYALAEGDDRCVRAISGGIVHDARRRGRGAANACAAVRDEPGTDFAGTLRVALTSTPRDAALLLVSDFYDVTELAPILRPLSGRCDVTALIVRDPWCDGLAIGGFVRLRDAETGAARRMYIGSAERQRFSRAVAQREADAGAALEAAGIRWAVLAGDPERALADAFGVA